MDEQAEDRAQNWQTLQTGASFYWMVYAPTATISVPATNSTFASTSTAISVGGSANDDGWNGTGVGGAYLVAIASVQVKVIETSGNSFNGYGQACYWDQNQNKWYPVPANPWMVMNPTNTYTNNHWFGWNSNSTQVQNINWEQGTFTIVAEAVDQLVSLFSTSTITIDITAPTVNLVTPLAGVAYSSYTLTVTGSATDNYGLSTSSGIQVSVYDNTQGVWVTTGTPDTVGCTPGQTFQLTAGQASAGHIQLRFLTTNHAYNVIARAVDAAGNISAYTTSYCTEISPSKPSDIPQSAVIAAQFPGASSYISNLAVITGTSYSPSNEYVTDVKYALKRLKDSLWWNWIPNGHVGTFIGNTGEVWNDTCTLSGQTSQAGRYWFQA